MKMKLTTSFRLAPVCCERSEDDTPLIDSEAHIALPVRSHERAAAVAFSRNPDATHCIVSTQGQQDATNIRRDSRTPEDWKALLGRKET